MNRSSVKEGIRMGDIVEMTNGHGFSALYLTTRERDGMMYLNGLSPGMDRQKIRLDKIEQSTLQPGRIYDVPYQTVLIAAKLLNRGFDHGTKTELYKQLEDAISSISPRHDFTNEFRKESSEEKRKQRVMEAEKRLPDISVVQPDDMELVK